MIIRTTMRYLINKCVYALSPVINAQHNRNYTHLSLYCLLTNWNSSNATEQESRKGKGKLKRTSPAARRGTQKGYKCAAKKPKRRRVNTSNEEEEWPRVIYGESSTNCRSRVV